MVFVLLVISILLILPVRILFYRPSLVGSFPNLMSSATSIFLLIDLSVFIFVLYEDNFLSAYLIDLILGNMPEPCTRFVNRLKRLTLFSLLFFVTSTFIIYEAY